MKVKKKRAALMTPPLQKSCEYPDQKLDLAPEEIKEKESLERKIASDLLNVLRSTAPHVDPVAVGEGIVVAALLREARGAQA